MINLCLKGCGALGLGFERLLKLIEDRSQPRKAPLNRGVESGAISVGGAFPNGLL